jgi:hypothetical protein
MNYEEAKAHLMRVFRADATTCNKGGYILTFLREGEEVGRIDFNAGLQQVQVDLPERIEGLEGHLFAHAESLEDGTVQIASRFRGVPPRIREILLVAEQHEAAVQNAVARTRVACGYAQGAIEYDRELLFQADLSEARATRALQRARTAAKNRNTVQLLLESERLQLLVYEANATRDQAEENARLALG